MAETFTSWSALLTKLKDALANWRPGVRMYQIDGKMLQYSNFDELKKGIEYVEKRVAIEEGKKAPRNTVARASGGRY